MDGRNCSGRKISLLNDSSDVAAAPYAEKIHLPPLLAHSRASSCASTPSLSPQTPQLVRSSSSDSRGFQTPSPLTPSFGSFEQGSYPPPTKSQHQQYYIAHHHSYSSDSKMDDQNASMYPPIPDVTGAMPSAYPMPPQMPPQMSAQQLQPPYRSSNSPASEPSRVSTVSNTSIGKNLPKKNQYPCPLAKQVGCTDFFTTSGHAARHAKKHTGKKDAFCPECNKAFTRKDNMEQHRRTHQNGRGATRSDNEGGPRIKKVAKHQPKKNAVKAESSQIEAAVEQQLAEQQQQVQQLQAAQAQPVMTQPILDQSLMVPPAGPYFLDSTVDTGPVPALPLAMPDLANVRPPLHRANFTTSLEYIPPTPSMLSADPDSLNYPYPSPGQMGLAHSLDSLALAASEHRRISEEKSSQSPSSESPSQETP